MKNYYKTLGISQHSSKEEIKKAFRELAFKYHPDKNTNLASIEKFKEINEAKQVLLNDFKKANYDEMLVDFLSGSNAARRAKGLKRRKYHNRALYLQLIKQTVFDRFFLGILFFVTVLSTIAFYKVPDEEELSSALIAKARTDSENKPLAETEIEVSYAPRETVKKEDPPFRIEKKHSGGRSHFRVTYSTKKATKKLRSNHQDKKSKQVVKAETNKPKKPAIKSPVAALVTTKHKKVLEKQLTNEKMIEILEQLKAEKLKFGSNSNCVQLVKSETSNISNVFVLANFLQGYGFIISGREKIPAAFNGIKIDVTSQCITISVGTL